MKFDILYIFAILLIITIVTTSIAATSFIAVRSEMAKIQADGIETCYGLNCTHNYLGYVKCWTEKLPEPEIDVLGGFEFEPSTDARVQE